MEREQKPMEQLLETPENVVWELQKKIKRKKYLESLIDSLDRRRYELKNKVLSLQIKAREELEDVDKLERNKFLLFFYRLIRQYDKKIDKERRESIAAAEKYNAAKCELDAVQEELNGYRNEIRSLENCEEQYNELIRKRLQIIKESQLKETKKVIEIEDGIAQTDNRINEITEAVKAGERAEGTIEKILSNLKSAEGWGKWDLFGGGLISHIEKHNCLDEAQELVEELQDQLQNLKTKLCDVELESDIKVNIDGFLRFADWFFDGIFVDLEVINRIQEASERLNTVHSQIIDMIKRLSELRVSAELEKKALQAKLEELLCSFNEK